MTVKTRFYLSIFSLSLCVACSDETGLTGDGGTDPDGGALSPDVGSGNDAGLAGSSLYQGPSRFAAGSSVNYGGQSVRHVLIEELKSYLGSLTDQTFPAPAPGDVVAALNYFYDFNNQGGTTDYPIEAFGSTRLAQSVIGDLSGLKGLKEKMPEIDAHFVGGVIGYGDGAQTPDQVVQAMFLAVEELVIARSLGNLPRDPAGVVIERPYLSASGMDYRELIQKYLVGAVAFSQGVDDYLDDSTPGKGMLSDNAAQVTGEPYTALEHAWDEGFGYFGAARDYANYTDDEVAGAGGRADWQIFHDTDGDGMIDLSAEYNFGHATNASKRDRGSHAAARTNFSEGAMQGFLRGRALIAASGALSPDQLDELRGYRDAAIDNWENAIAATVVHYINDVLRDMNAFDTEAYVFADHAKHWSELKGFALILQFNVRYSPWSPGDFAELHEHLGVAPVLPGDAAAAIADYTSALLAARELVQATYGFAAANMGDENGVGGW